MERVRGRGQGFPRGQYAQLPVVENDRDPFVYRYARERWNGREDTIHTFIAQLLQQQHVHSIKIIGHTHSSGGLLHGDNRRIPSMVPTFFSYTIKRTQLAMVQTQRILLAQIKTSWSARLTLHSSFERAINAL